MILRDFDGGDSGYSLGIVEQRERAAFEKGRQQGLKEARELLQAAGVQPPSGVLAAPPHIQ